MKCKACRADIEGEWKFCPNCGRRSGDNVDNFSLFEDIFTQFNKEFKGMEKLFEQDFETYDLSKGKPKSRGFSIKIVSGTGKEPKVSVQTFGDDRDKVRARIASRLGIAPARPQSMAAQPAKQLANKPVRETESTEEPKGEAKWLGNSLTVSIKLPGVKSEHDVEINDLENSIEVRAYVGKKAYFKILKKPDGFRMREKSFSNEELRLTIS